MRKDLLLPALAVTGGGAGFVLRYWQHISYFDGEAMLFLSGAPAMTALLLVMAALALSIGVLSWGGMRQVDYKTAFFCPSTLYVVLMTAGSFLLLGAAGLGLLKTMQQLRLWRAGAAVFPIMNGLAAVLCVPGAIAGLMLGRGNYRNDLPQSAPLLATLPAYMLLPWIVALYQDNSRQPDLASFALFLIGAVCAELGFYAAASFSFERPRPWMCPFFSLAGVMLLLTSLADHLDRFYTVLSLAIVLLLLAQSSAVLRSGFGPPWPRRMYRRRGPKQKPDNNTDETEDETER